MADFKQPYFHTDGSFTTGQPVDTVVDGKIPEWLCGSLYRNGPGVYQIGQFRLKHLFDGFAVMHRFHIDGGKVTYTSSVLDTMSWQESVKANRLVATQFGTFSTPDPCKSIFSRVMSFFKPRETETTDNVSVNVVEHGDRLYALTETPWLIRVHPEELRVVGREDLKRTMAVHLSTAHPHFDADGNMYNLATAFNPPHNYNIVRIPPATSSESEELSQVQLLASLTSRWTFTIGYNHSFGMSRDHFVILEQPITMESIKFLTNNWRKAAPYDNFTKRPNEELIFRLVRRDDNKELSIKYRAKATFTFHFANCYEDGKYLVVDFVGYYDLSIIDNLYLERLDQEPKVKAVPTFRRYVLPLSLEQAQAGQNLVNLPGSKATATLRADGTVFLTPDLLVEGGVRMELPQINYAQMNGRKYRYVYGTQLFMQEPKLVKVDLEQREVLTWKDEGFTPGEPVFVPSPGATREDEGVILSPVVGNKADQQCYLLILDASTFMEIARASTPPGVLMSLSFHGTYVTPEPKTGVVTP